VRGRSDYWKTLQFTPANALHGIRSRRLRRELGGVDWRREYRHEEWGFLREANHCAMGDIDSADRADPQEYGQTIKFNGAAAACLGDDALPLYRRHKRSLTFVDVPVLGFPGATMVVGRASATVMK